MPRRTPGRRDTRLSATFNPYFSEGEASNEYDELGNRGRGGRSRLHGVEELRRTRDPLGRNDPGRLVGLQVRPHTHDDGRVVGGALWNSSTDGSGSSSSS